MKRKVPYIVPAVIAALVLAQSLFVAGYVGHEHTIYFWDHAMYYHMALNLRAAFGRGFGEGWSLLKASLGENYNLLFALPSLVTFAVFDSSRVTFIVTNFLVFFLAYEAAVAFFLARVMRFENGHAMIASLVISSLIPPLWIPLLEGYPDAGAAGCIVLAAALGLQEKNWRRAAGLGLALGGAVLLRRHFVYPALALLLALGILSALELWRAHKNRGQILRRLAIYYAIGGASFAGLLLLIAPGFVIDALTTDYNALYLSYRRPPLEFLRFMLGGFGFLLIAASIGGYAMLAKFAKQGRTLASFMGLFIFLWLLIWIMGPDQMGHHYMLHGLPFVLTVGLAGWIWFYEKSRHRARRWAVAGLLLVLGGNSAWALWLSPAGVWPNDNGTPGLLSAARPPVVRNDVEEWHRLADYLKKTTTPGDRIMVVGSSFVFNEDIFNNVYAESADAYGMMMRFPKAPEIDHEEPAPLDSFASADVYVVPTPAQYHLDPDGQRVVTAAANRFPPPADMRALFVPDDASFALENGTAVKIWRRKGWTPALLHETLGAIRHDAKADAQFAQSWAITRMPLRAYTRTGPDGLSIVAGLFDKTHDAMSLFFDAPLAAGSGRIGMIVDGNCGTPVLTLRVLRPDGGIAGSKDFTPVLVPGEVFQSFEIPAGDEGDFLELSLKPQPTAFCHMELHDLRLQKI